MIVYSHKTSPRFQYIVNEIFKRHLGLDYTITNSIDDFLESEDIKLCYSKDRIGDSVFIKSSGLLFSKGISNIELEVEKQSEVPYLFPTNGADLPFDVFSASFYMLSRYEEYLKGESGKFNFRDSVAYANNFMEIPVVDIWAKMLKDVIKNKYTQVVFENFKYSYTSIIEVEKAYMHKGKGVIRTLGRSLIDLVCLNLAGIVKRFRVLTGIEQDPYDVYQSLIDFHKERKINCIFFFSVSDYNMNDRPMSFLNQRYRGLIKYVSDYCIVSVLGSYNSILKAKVLKEEKDRMSNIINRRVKRFKSNNNFLQIPQTYRNLSEKEFAYDYNMGYNSCIGFRAGTSKPFKFYDLGLEIKSSVTVFPFCFHSGMIRFHNQKEIEEKLGKIRDVIQKVDGDFRTVFTNTFFRIYPLDKDSNIYKKFDSLTNEK